MPPKPVIDFAADDVGEFELPEIPIRATKPKTKPKPDDIEDIASDAGYDRKERDRAAKPKSRPKRAHKAPKIAHKSVPAINGVFAHIYERGGPNTQTSIRFPDPVLERLDNICATYGLKRWQAINLMMLHFETAPPE